MGGRAAEEIVFNEHHDRGAATTSSRPPRLARKMVCEWGMSSTLGPVAYGQKEEQIFLGKEIAAAQDYSEETAERSTRRSASS